ncbi:DAGKc domain-containing protein [Mycena kentingensis (nom. inval.)]|nr:DAGKc domain-containing protein [Mycena kentingensis (nom. inval.)]
MAVLGSFLSLLWPSRATQYERISRLQASSSLSDDKELSFSENGVCTSLRIEEDGVHVVVAEAGWFSRPYTELVLFLNILSTSVSLTPGGRSMFFAFSYLSARNKGRLELRQLSGDVTDAWGAALDRWVESVQALAYKGLTPGRRFLVLVNPHGGQGKAKAMWQETVEPIFAAAGCVVDVQYTGPASSPTNASSIARNLDLAAYDALVPLSGDGIVSELLNGLASRPDARTALRIPIAPLPAGSGNALSVNLMSPDKVVDVAYAALNAIKGHPMPLDICSVSQGSTRRFSFLSQAFGLMADLDMGTEWIRWIGGIRFVLGYIWGALTGASYSVEITMKIVESDKRRMVDAYNTLRDAKPIRESSTPTPPPTDALMPLLAFGSTDAPLPLGTVHTTISAPLEPGWHTFCAPVQFVCAGKLPWLSRDSMMLPLAADDGLIDVVLVPPRSAFSSLTGMDGQEEGRFMRLPDVYYYKVEAYRCTPGEKSGYISIDGESIPYEAFQVENHARLARIMSLDGRWKGLESASLE